MFQRKPRRGGALTGPRSQQQPAAAAAAARPTHDARRGAKRRADRGRADRDERARDEPETSQPETSQRARDEPARVEPATSDDDDRLHGRGWTRGCIAARRVLSDGVSAKLGRFWQAADRMPPVFSTAGFMGSTPSLGSAVSAWPGAVNARRPRCRVRPGRAGYAGAGRGQAGQGRAGQGRAERRRQRRRRRRRQSSHRGCGDASDDAVAVSRGS